MKEINEILAQHKSNTVDMVWFSVLAGLNPDLFDIVLKLTILESKFGVLLLSHFMVSCHIFLVQRHPFTLYLNMQRGRNVQN